MSGRSTFVRSSRNMCTMIGGDHGDAIIICCMLMITLRMTLCTHYSLSCIPRCFSETGTPAQQQQVHQWQDVLRICRCIGHVSDVHHVHPALSYWHVHPARALFNIPIYAHQNAESMPAKRGHARRGNFHAHFALALGKWPPRHCGCVLNQPLRCSLSRRQLSLIKVFN